MKLPENSKIASAVLAGAILVSVFGIGALKMSSARRSAEAVFYKGTDTSLSVNHSLDSYLERAETSAVKLAGECERILGEGSAQAVKDAAKELSDAGRIADRYSAYKELSRQIQDLWTRVLAKEPDPTEALPFYKDYQSAADLIKNDAYNTYAGDYNGSAGSFPAGLIAGIYGMDPLDTFGG